MRHRLLAMLATAVLLAAACGDDDGGEGAAPAQGGTATQAPTSEAPAADAASPGGTGLGLATTPLGEILVDGEGMTLYLFVPDAQGESTCYGQCEASWPPLSEVSGVAGGLDESLLGTTTRTDGTVQATYNGWPLYHFARDAAPGDTNGQGLNEVWYVVDAAGEAVRGATAGSDTTAAGAPSY